MTGAACGAPPGDPRRQIRGTARATPDGASSGLNRWAAGSAARTNPRTADSRRNGGAAAVGAHAGRRTRPHAHAAPAAASCAVRAAGSAPAGGVLRPRLPPSAGAWGAADARASRRPVRCQDRRRWHGSDGDVVWWACVRREAVRRPLRPPPLPRRRALLRPDAGGVAVRMGGVAAGRPPPLPSGPSGPGVSTRWRVCGERGQKVSL